MKIHLAVLEARQAKRLSQTQLAERTGLSPTYISKVENSCLIPTICTLVRVAGGLDITPGQLLDRALDPSLDDTCVHRRGVIMRNGNRRVVPVRQACTLPRRIIFPLGSHVRDPAAIAARRRLGREIMGRAASADAVCACP
jgi:transcriptional regulator with XRE-family HTH domain